MEPVETFFIQHFLTTARAAGFSPCIVDDGEESHAVTTDAEVLEQVDATDESRVYFRRKDKAAQREYGAGKECIHVILGNGLDCISDASCGRADWDGVNQASYEFWEQGEEVIQALVLDEQKAVRDLCERAFTLLDSVAFVRVEGDTAELLADMRKALHK